MTQDHATTQQHWVPQFYLKKWSFSKGKVHCFDKISQKSFAPNVSNVAGARWFYDTESMRDGSKPETYQIVEKFLADLEGRCGSLFDDLVEEGDKLAAVFDGSMPKTDFTITPGQRKDLSIFMALQLLRTDETRAFMSTILNTAVQKGMEAVLPIGMPEVDPSKYKATVNLDEIKRLHLIQLMEFLEFAPYFYKKRWRICINPNTKLLVTSDNPIVKIPAIPGEDGLDSYGVRHIFPLSPKLVLTMYDAKFFPLRFNGLAFLTEKTVDEYNELELLQSRRQIYSAQDDFQFAQKLCEDNPTICKIDAGKEDLANLIVEALVQDLVEAALIERNKSDGSQQPS